MKKTALVLFVLFVLAGCFDQSSTVKPTTVNSTEAPHSNSVNSGTAKAVDVGLLAADPDLKVALTAVIEMINKNADRIRNLSKENATKFLENGHSVLSSNSEERIVKEFLLIDMATYKSLSDSYTYHIAKAAENHPELKTMDDNDRELLIRDVVKTIIAEKASLYMADYTDPCWDARASCNDSAYNTYAGNFAICVVLGAGTAWLAFWPGVLVGGTCMGYIADLYQGDLNTCTANYQQCVAKTNQY